MALCELEDAELLISAQAAQEAALRAEQEAQDAENAENEVDEGNLILIRSSPTRLSLSYHRYCHSSNCSYKDL